MSAKRKPRPIDPDTAAPITKLAELRALLASGENRAALKLAASFADLGAHSKRIRQGWEALARPAFYRQIGKEPEALAADGLAAIREKYLIG